MRAVDLAVQPWDAALVRWAEAVGISVPMHTAMRLGLHAARRIRGERPGLPICLYGLYAGISREATLGVVADRLIAGEYEGELLAWVERVAAGRPAAPGAPVVYLGRPGKGGAGGSLPARDVLPPLHRYAHLRVGGEERLVGYVEASRGCAHRCAHCPVPVIYDGRVRRAEEDRLVEDVAALVGLGARHLTFGDPDFMNAPQHSLRVVRAVHDAFPDVTFDCTVKVEHILARADVWAELARARCLFVVSAFESCNDAILGHLDKGHTVANASAAVGLLRGHGIEIRPSFLPFTPWATVADVAAILQFVVEHDLVANVDAVQYAIRLLLPEGSLLLGREDVRSRLRGYDAEQLTWRWEGDLAADALQRDLIAIATEDARATQPAPATETFLRIWAAVCEAAGTSPDAPAGAVRAGAGRPRLTEPWFC